MILNVMHRSCLGPKYAIFRRQQELVHALGLRCTVFVHHRDTFDATAVRDIKDDAARHGDEIGLALHDLGGPGVGHLTNNLPALWLLDRQRKRKVLEVILARFRETFGHDPASIASYHLDSSSLAILRELSPSTRTVVGGCFEEGVRVFHGCNHSWYLFNEGMPWNPWYPSRTHALRPAADEAEATGFVAVPHLVRDMSLSYEGRNDFWASHPPNVVRGMGNDASFNPYDLNLVDQFRMQEDFNAGYSYLNTFVSVNWLTWNHNSEYPPEVCWHLYETYLRYFVRLRQEGALVDMTLSDYGEWHRRHRPLGTPERYLAKELLYGSGKHYLWYLDPMMRCLVDTNQGGSIGDLRPYCGKVEVATGPDTPHREIGSYPYLIQSQHRTGYAHHHEDGARTTLLVERGAERIDLASRPTRVLAIDTTDEATTVELAPIVLGFGDGTAATLATTLRFPHHGGRVEIRRHWLPGPGVGELCLVERVKAAPGRTEYAEDLHGIDLLTEASGSQAHPMRFDYSGTSHGHPGARRSFARVPQVRSTMSLEVEGGSHPEATVRAGHLFSPYFTLEVAVTVSAEERILTLLSLTPLA